MLLYNKEKELIQMTGIKKHFCLALCVIYIGSLLLPSFLACPCHASGSEARQPGPSDKPTGHCPEAATEGCCATAAPEIALSKIPDENKSDCCVSGGQCLHCTQCYSANQYLPVHEQISVNPDLNPAFIDDTLVRVTNSPVVSAVIDHPPDRIRLALHISTTVLLC